MRITDLLLKFLFSRWGFLRAPEHPQDESMREAFEGLWGTRGMDSVLQYDLPYAKADFTRWLTQEKGVLLHGSNQAGIERLEPRKQINFKGKPVEGVFASSDGIWPMYFALLDFQNPDLQVTRNGCFSLGDERFYLFCINQEALAHPIWKKGWLYVLPAEGFESQDPGGMWQSEWVSESGVEPLACLPVTEKDFPFRQGVVGFRRGESLLKTWSSYGRRRKMQESPLGKDA